MLAYSDAITRAPYVLRFPMRQSACCVRIWNQLSTKVLLSRKRKLVNKLSESGVHIIDSYWSAGHLCFSHAVATLSMSQNGVSSSTYSRRGNMNS